jgi:serine/threonine protein kinase
MSSTEVWYSPYSHAAKEIANGLSDLKPENLLYLTRKPDSQLVLADFGIAKMLDSNQVLTTMAGSFGYAAPEVMEKKGHGKPVDMWSLGVITYTLLCGYSPFRSESMSDLIEECRNERVIFHPRYWSDVSEEAKDFIRQLLKADPKKRPTSAVNVTPNDRIGTRTNPLNSKHYSTSGWMERRPETTT